MELAKTKDDLQLTLSLTDADLLDLVRQPRTRSFSEPLTRSRDEQKGNLVAHYSAREGTLTFSGLLGRRFPVQFSLRHGSRSHSNFIRFMLRELELLGSSLAPESGAGISRALIGMRASLEQQLASELQATPAESTAAACSAVAAAAELGVEDIVEVFRSDIEQFRRGARRSDGARSRVFARHHGLGGEPSENGGVPPLQRRFKLLHPEGAGVQLISGFISLELGRLSEEFTAVEAAHPARSVEQRLSLLRSSLKVETPQVTCGAGQATVSIELTADPQLNGSLQFTVHWGPRFESAQGVWLDEELGQEECVVEGEGKWRLTKVITSDRPGWYGLTGYVCVEGSNERVWFSHGGAGDTSFEMLPQLPCSNVPELCRELVEEMDVQRRIVCGLSDFKSFVRTVHQLQRGRKVRGLGKLLYDAVQDNPNLRGALCSYYRLALLEYEQRELGLNRAHVKRVITLLQNIGIGEVVFVAPEGPHAIAGGLAQVIVGLMKALSRCGVSCTVITPLYESAQGSKHQSAEELLCDGVMLLGKRVPISQIGEVKIPLGGTYRSGSSQPTAFPSLVTAKVYQAEHEGVRLIFLRNRRYAERLYGPAGADDLLRRAVFLSRGALEVLRDPKFRLRPHIVITNDWLSALVPVFLKTDPRYAEDPRFHGVETSHVIHNGGKAYQGRLPLYHHGEDLWPVLGIGGEHVFGLLDPGDRSQLNLTAAAAFHTSRALVAVSKPYAGQLMTSKGGEGLHEIFSEQAQALFGISNGVDLSALRAVFYQLGESARKELGLAPLLRKRRTQGELVKWLPVYKSSVKQIVQRKYGLNQDPAALLLSLVGRLAEQKGIQLLSGVPEGESLTVLESILVQFPQVQFLIAGPPAHGDHTVHELEALVSDLTRRYPGRIRGVFDFIPHEAALEITQSSDLFLMPSRYEPGGITQLEALAAGTLVVARNVGGLRATLVDYCQVRGQGDSFLFTEFSSAALKQVICRALHTIDHDATRLALIRQAALAENDWSHRAPKYLSILQHAAGVLNAPFEYLAARRHLLASLRASRASVEAG